MQMGLLCEPSDPQHVYVHLLCIRALAFTTCTFFQPSFFPLIFHNFPFFQSTLFITDILTTHIPVCGGERIAHIVCSACRRSRLRDGDSWVGCLLPSISCQEC